MGKKALLAQGPRSTFSSGGAKEECEKENFGGGGGGVSCLWISIQFLSLHDLPKIKVETNKQFV